MMLQLALIAQESHDRDLSRLEIKGCSLRTEIFVHPVPIFFEIGATFPVVCSIRALFASPLLQPLFVTTYALIEIGTDGLLVALFRPTRILCVYTQGYS